MREERHLCTPSPQYFDCSDLLPVVDVDSDDPLTTLTWYTVVASEQ